MILVTVKSYNFLVSLLKVETIKPVLYLLCRRSVKNMPKLMEATQIQKYYGNHLDLMAVKSQSNHS